MSRPYNRQGRGQGRGNSRGRYPPRVSHGYHNYYQSYNNHHNNQGQYNNGNNSYSSYQQQYDYNYNYDNFNNRYQQGYYNQSFPSNNGNSSYNVNAQSSPHYSSHIQPNTNQYNNNIHTHRQYSPSIKSPKSGDINSLRKESRQVLTTPNVEGPSSLPKPPLKNSPRNPTPIVKENDVTNLTSLNSLNSEGTIRIGTPFQNPEIAEKQSKILQWKKSKKAAAVTADGSIKKKSLMNFKRKNNKQLPTALVNKTPSTSVLEKMDLDDEEEENNKNGKITSEIEYNFDDSEEEDEEEEEEEEASSENLSGKNVLSITSKDLEEEKEGDGEDDLDKLLSNLQSEEEHSKIDIEKNKIFEDTDEENELPVDIIEDVDQEEVGNEAARLLKKLSGKDKKNVPQHEYSTQPFDRKFYVECDLIKSLTKTEVKTLRENDSVVIKGKNNIIKPILEWSHLGLPSSIYSVLQTLKYDSPTPIQCEALPHIMNGNDFIGIAQTGSGKTIAFLLPLFRQLLSSNGEKKHQSGYTGAKPRAIIITPTRELTLQIAKTAKPFADKLNLKICKCYGGQSISKQIADLKKDVDIIVGTPGRIIDLLCTNGGRILNLSDIRYLVMDEADRMFDMGFEPQILKILQVIRPDRQTVLFSATFPPKIQSLARKILDNPVEVLIGSKNIVNENIEQHFEIVENEESKFNKLLQILGNKYKENDGKVLIFVERQDSCDKMVKKLLSRGYAVMSLHGGKDQTERGGTIRDFKNGVIDIIVATSVASRGLDVDNLKLVINYDAPSHIEDYVHRVGRTGRGGNSGESFTILTPNEEKCASDLVRVLKVSKLEIPKELAEMATKFENKVKEGEMKFGSGFGGKGLEKLQAIREKNESLEKQVYLKDENGDGGGDKKKERGGEGISQEGYDLDVLKNFRVEYSTAARGLEATRHYAELNINDLPARTRAAVGSRETMHRVVEATGAAVTMRGRFVPAGAGPAGGEKKLHLLVEGDEAAVGRAVALLREAVLGALARETAPAAAAIV